jgi:RNA polymerase sigma factor (sigma-70 family)
MSEGKSRFDIIGQLGSMRRYARSLTRDSADAEDLVHDALVRAYERRETFRQGGNLRAWLLSVLHNSFIDRGRSQRAEAGRIAQSEYLAESRMEPPQDHVVRLAQVKEAFLDLPEEQRSALHLVAIEGLSYQEAAFALAIPVGTLMSRIGRARASLRNMEDNAATQPKNRLRIVGGRDEGNR